MPTLLHLDSSAARSPSPGRSPRASPTRGEQHTRAAPYTYRDLAADPLLHVDEAYVKIVTRLEAGGVRDVEAACEAAVTVGFGGQAEDLRLTLLRAQQYVSSVTVELFSDQLTGELEEELRIKVFKALSDPVRLQIIRYLRKVDRGVTCGEIGAVIKIGKSAGSYHFKILREARLTLTRKDAREKYVSLNYDTFHKYVLNFFESL